LYTWVYSTRHHLGIPEAAIAIACIFQKVTWRIFIQHKNNNIFSDIYVTQIEKHNN